MENNEAYMNAMDFLLSSLTLVWKKEPSLSAEVSNKIQHRNGPNMNLLLTI